MVAVRVVLGVTVSAVAVAAAAAAAKLTTATSDSDGYDQGLGRDTRLDRSLAELLANPLDDRDGIDAAIAQTLTHCRLRGITGVMQSVSYEDTSSDAILGEDGGGDVAFCHRVRFVRHARLRQRDRELVLQQLRESDQDYHAATAAVDERRADDLDYQTFFETFAERPTPLVVTQTPPLLDAETKADAASFWRACFDARDRAAPLRLSDNACIPWLERFHIPLLAVNNFIPRTSVATSAALVPTLLTIAESAAPVTCPFGLHTVLIPAVDAVEFQLYDAQYVPFDLPRGDDASSASYAEVSVSADATVSRFDGNAGLHGSPIINPAFKGLLKVEQTLFVPGGKYAASLRGTSTVLRVCVVDASNLNHVAETLRVDALVNNIARHLFLSLQSPVFDATMTRQPSRSDTRWANYMLWPKETKLLKRRDMLSTESVGTGGDHSPVPMSRRERLKLWQDDKRWARHIASLTLPVPLAPVVLNSTRDSVTLRWQDLYTRPKHDITPFGYEVHWRREDATDATDEAEKGEEDGILIHDGAVNFTHTQLVRSAMPTALFGDAFDGKDIEGVVYGLAPDAIYSFTIRLYVGSTFGVASERSRSAAMASCSVPSRVAGVVAAVNGSGECLDVRWLASSDDGGRRITSYVFALRYVDSSLEAGAVDPEQVNVYERLTVLKRPSASSTTSKKTRQSPLWLSGSICDQIPGRVRVRVAAVNAIGVSVWSQRSEPMRMMGANRPRIVPTVRGHGDPAFVSSPDHLLNQSNVASISTHPRVVLSDIDQYLLIANARVDVWTGHYSPQRFTVSSELVLAEPLDASQPLYNAIDVRDRVVVIARGNVPFLFKLRHAQRAGALGVVFADLEHRCVRGFDQRCVPGATKRQGEGFGVSDRHPLWREIRIPFVLAQPESSPALKALLRQSSG